MRGKELSMRQRHSSVVISPSLSSTDWGKLKEILRKVQSAGIDTVHCDIEDGNFVPNISFGPKIIEKIIDLTELPVSVHLMVANPELVLKMLSGINVLPDKRLPLFQQGYPGKVLEEYTILLDMVEEPFLYILH